MLGCYVAFELERCRYHVRVLFCELSLAEVHLFGTLKAIKLILLSQLINRILNQRFYLIRCTNL
jgi:hypothetical protein